MLICTFGTPSGKKSALSSNEGKMLFSMNLICLFILSEMIESPKRQDFSSIVLSFIKCDELKALQNLNITIIYLFTKRSRKSEFYVFQIFCSTILFKHLLGNSLWYGSLIFSPYYQKNVQLFNISFCQTRN